MEPLKTLTLVLKRFLTKHFAHLTADAFKDAQCPLMLSKWKMKVERSLVAKVPFDALPVTAIANNISFFQDVKLHVLQLRGFF